METIQNDDNKTSFRLIFKCFVNFTVWHISMLIIPFETLNIEKGHLNRWEGLSSFSILHECCVSHCISTCIPYAYSRVGVHFHADTWAGSPVKAA